MAGLPHRSFPAACKTPGRRPRRGRSAGTRQAGARRRTTCGSSDLAARHARRVGSSSEARPWSPRPKPVFCPACGATVDLARA
eukprot:859202-Alexandrium_andersonii.AAC.1